MKRAIDIKCFIWGMGIILLSCIALSSCKKQNTADIKIDGVWTNQYPNPTVQINISNLGAWVRLQGHGFSGLRAIYCNGVATSFSAANVTDNNIIFSIPAVLPTGGDIADTTVRNTIRIVTKNGEAVYNHFVFRDVNRIPAINGVSATMPFPGDMVVVSGKNLKNTTKVEMPGSLAVSIAAKTDTTIAFTVPAGIDMNKSGAISLTIDGTVYSTPPYMYYREGIFMETTTDAQVPQTGGTGYTTLSGANVAAATKLANNPQNVIAIPAAAKDIAVGTGNDDKNNTGFLRFQMVKALQKVIDNSANQISATTQMNNLGIQFELYMNQPWTSGVISYRMNISNGGANSFTTNNFGWWAGLSTASYNFNNQWQTVTIPLSYFKATSGGLPLGTLQSYITDNASVNSGVAFVNYYQNFPSKALSKFQLFVANLRIVPMVTNINNN
ncbi:hypothetical protein IM793_22240 [Pedobacter sp. MR2016-19]|uniref:glycan-binding surface protein n=1 Tax=Pedobacter sp. MR2016-19 TaxID=2780089 RepID=UPI0018737918|nr:glycan-binding surface protein [Pedobacter sp. MR2016-19]MBE5321892.1 hypothetical protein [Pedobacter sp. MR2016-19]